MLIISPATKIDTIKGLEYNAIEDVQYFREKLFAALKIPKAFMGYEKDLTGKATLAADKKVGNGWTITTEGTFTKQLNASVFQNIALPSTGLYRLSDGRWRFPYTSSYPYGGSQMGGTAKAAPNNPTIGNAIYMTNAHVGHIAFGTLQIQKQTKNLIASVAYTRQVAMDASINGSTASTMWGSRPTSVSCRRCSTGPRCRPTA